MIGDLIGWTIFGLIAGAVARLLTPGDDSMGCLATIGLGIVGSMIGGFLWNLFFGDNEPGIQPAGFIGAVIGAVLFLFLLRQLRPAKPRP